MTTPKESSASTTTRRTALVTGATSPLGAAIVTDLADAGYFVGVHYRSNGERANELVSMCREKNTDAIALHGDLTDTDAATNVVKSFVEAAGKIDALVNNAGVARDDLFFFLNRATWDEVVTGNLASTYEVSRAAIKDMITRKDGRVINIASASAMIGLPGQAHYAAAKAGITGMTRALAREFGRFGILVNAIAPGAIESPAIEKLDEKHRQFLLDGTALGRFGRPEEVSSLVVYLASKRSTYVTGQVFAVDGGVTS